MLISKNALIKRINRKLSREDEQLRTLRGERDWSNLGNYYITNGRNNVMAAHVNLERLGRELGALKAHETVEG